MRESSFAPAYVAIYPMMADIARECGYSLSIHGSVGRTASSDIDLVAAPWTIDCKDPEYLMFKFSERMVCWFNEFCVECMKGLEPELKPHGRLAYRIPCGNGSAIDISIMPKIGAQP